MAAIRPIDTITEKFITVTPGRATQYKQGVENPLMQQRKPIKGALQRQLVKECMARA